MKSKTCCFIGHRQAKRTEELKRKIEEIVCELIVKYGVEKFLFGSKSDFDDACYQVVTAIKEKKFNNIERVYVRAEYSKITDEYIKYLLKSYEETYMPQKVERAGKGRYVVRNKEMIEISAIVVFYYDEENAREKSGTKIAYEYAKKKGKRIINIIEKT